MPKTPTRAIRISDDLWNRLQAAATHHRMPVSQLIRDALRAYIEGSGNGAVQQEATGTGADEG